MNPNLDQEFITSVANRGIQELTFVNSNAANILAQAKRQQKIAQEYPTQEQIDEIDRTAVDDNVVVTGAEKSVGTIIKQVAMKKALQYKKLSHSDIALTDCGMNHIVDLTWGSLTNQKDLFTERQWKDVRKMFPPLKHSLKNPFAGEEMESFAKKIKNGLSNADLDECYWNIKILEKKSKNYASKTGYNLVSTLINKYTLHPSLFNIAAPAPSESDFIVKIWGDVLEALFARTGLYIRWGEKAIVENTENVIFKLDTKIVLVYDKQEYTVSNAEFATYAGPRKIKSDRSKLLVEAKLIYDKIIKLKINDEMAKDLQVPSLQIMGLEAHLMTTRNIARSLYAGNSVSTIFLPSNRKELKVNSMSLLKSLYDYKLLTLEVAENMKSNLVQSKKKLKSMKRKLVDVDSDEEPEFAQRLTKTWRFKTDTVTHKTP